MLLTKFLPRLMVVPTEFLPGLTVVLSESLAGLTMVLSESPPSLTVVLVEYLPGLALAVPSDQNVFRLQPFKWSTLSYHQLPLCTELEYLSIRLPDCCWPGLAWLLSCLPPLFDPCLNLTTVICCLPRSLLGSDYYFACCTPWLLSLLRTVATP